MSDLARYTTSNLGDLMERISKNSIGLDNYFDQFFELGHSQTYPPYNLIHVDNVESKLEIALAGFKKKEIKVYTEYGKLTVEGNKEDKGEATMHIEDLHQDLSIDLGHYLMMWKLKMYHLQMDFSQLH